MRQISPERTDLAQTAVIALVTVAAVVLLAMVAARWSWTWFAPSPAPRAQSVGVAGGAAPAGGLFGDARRDAGASSPARTGNAIRLLGIVAASPGRRGYALVQLEANEQLAVLEGEEIVPGLRLAEIAADHLILERSGARETLSWPEKNAATQTPVFRAGN
ncbi:MAG TPA: type II secretion system protein N, partial [Burkholderiales bacterium]|nr:type II secretion system protein N [Burkholderiales bacterium]